MGATNPTPSPSPLAGRGESRNDADEASMAKPENEHWLRSERTCQELASVFSIRHQVLVARASCP
jgi:hypothetical protein